MNKTGIHLTSKAKLVLNQNMTGPIKPKSISKRKIINKTVVPVKKDVSQEKKVGILLNDGSTRTSSEELKYDSCSAQ